MRSMCFFAKFENSGKCNNYNKILCQCMRTQKNCWRYQINLKSSKVGFKKESAIADNKWQDVVNFSSSRLPNVWRLTSLTYVHSCNKSTLLDWVDIGIIDLDEWYNGITRLKCPSIHKLFDGEIVFEMIWVDELEKGNKYYFQSIFPCVLYTLVHFQTKICVPFWDPTILICSMTVSLMAFRTADEAVPGLAVVLYPPAPDPFLT